MEGDKQQIHKYIICQVELRAVKKLKQDKGIESDRPGVLSDEVRPGQRPKEVRG